MNGIHALNFLWTHIYRKRLCNTHVIRSKINYYKRNKIDFFFPDNVNVILQYAKNFHQNISLCVYPLGVLNCLYVRHQDENVFFFDRL